MALAEGKTISDLADGLTTSANAIHDRLTKTIKEERVDPATAQRIFQDEAILRQRANALYIDAAGCVVTDLTQTQKSLLVVVEAANDRIDRIKTVAQLTDLVADLLVLTASACAAKVGPIVAALQEVKKDIEEVEGK